MTETQDTLRAARQLIETSRLLGADFVPVRAGAESPEAEPAPSPRAAPGVSAPDHSDKAQRLAELEQAYEREMPPEPGAQHTRVVFGDGNPDADLMFVGEAPGAEEDKQGIPFVGRAGQKLNDMIKAMGLSREEVYIANVLKRRPPGNATPTPEEAATHGPWLIRQIEIIEPRVLVTLGKPAANFLLGNTEAMGRLRGHWFEFAGVPLMPTFHPAYLLRAYTEENRRKVWSDLQMAMTRLRGSDS